MKNKIFRLIAGCLLGGLVLVSASSCGGYRKIKITEAKPLSFKATSMRTAKVTLSVTIDNPAPAFSIENLTGTLHKGSKKADMQILATGLCPKRIEVPAKQTSNFQIVINIELDKSLNIVQAGLLMANLKIEEYRIDISAKAHKGMITKKIQKKNIPLKNFMPRSDNRNNL